MHQDILNLPYWICHTASSTGLESGSRRGFLATMTMLFSDSIATMSTIYVTLSLPESLREHVITDYRVWSEDCFPAIASSRGSKSLEMDEVAICTFLYRPRKLLRYLTLLISSLLC